MHPPRLRNIAETNRHAICSILVYRTWLYVVTIIGIDRGENLSFSNGQEINHKMWIEGEKQNMKGSHSK